jgi:perosamine synthetase
MTVRIPLAKPEITDADRQTVLDVLRTPHLSMGPKLLEFEGAICEYTQSKFAVAVNSGTSALQLAVRALSLEQDAEVILPSFTFSALLNVILQEGLRPKFVDINPDTYNTTPELIAAAITPQTRLILAVHTFGFPIDVNAIMKAAQNASSRAGRPRDTVHIIEDACEALGAEVCGRKVGSIAAAGLFAFYPNKQITTGEGGMLVSCDEKLAEAARKLRNQGRDPDVDWLQHTDAGFSYRMSDINCALGISQLGRIEGVLRRRQQLAEAYDRRLAAVDGIIRPPLQSEVGRTSWFVYPIRLEEKFSRADRERVCQSLLRKGIASGRYFAPLHQQPVISSLQRDQAGRDFLLPVTESVADRVIALPFFNELTETQIQEVCAALGESIGEARRKM